MNSHSFNKCMLRISGMMSAPVIITGDATNEDEVIVVDVSDPL